MKLNFSFVALALAGSALTFAAPLPAPTIEKAESFIRRVGADLVDIRSTPEFASTTPRTRFPPPTRQPPPIPANTAPVTRGGDGHYGYGGNAAAPAPQPGHDGDYASSTYSYYNGQGYAPAPVPRYYSNGGYAPAPPAPHPGYGGYNAPPATNNYGGNLYTGPPHQSVQQHSYAAPHTNHFSNEGPPGIVLPGYGVDPEYARQANRMQHDTYGRTVTSSWFGSGNV